MARQSRLTNIAIHEAGHAVAAFREGLRIRSVTIRAEDDALGQLVVQHPRWFLTEINDGTDKARVVAHAIKTGVVMFAGPAAERAHTGRHNHRGADYDYAAVGQLAATLCGGERQRRALLRWLRVTAEELVKIPGVRRQIVVVADALVKREQLSRQDVVRLLLTDSSDAPAPEIVSFAGNSQR